MYRCPVDTTVAVRPVVFAITWLFVSTRPDLLMTMPVAAAASPWYCRSLLMTTRPGMTALCTFWTAALLTRLPDPELPEFPELPEPPEFP